MIYKVALSLLLCFCGCTLAEKKEKPVEKKIQVLSTIPMIGDLVSQIGQERVESSTLIRGGLDPHTYELVKGDDEYFQNADLIFYNGLGLEHGYSLRHQLENHPRAMALGDFLFQVEPSLVIKIEEEVDPHIWMDIALWAKIVDPIASHLSKIDPENAEGYARNAALLKEKMLKSDLQAYHNLQSIPEDKRYLVTSHNAFNYFVRRYLATVSERSEERWGERLHAPEGLAPEAEISVHDLQRVLRFVEEKNISILFPESNVNKDALKKIVQVGSGKGRSLKLSKKALFADAMQQNSNYLEMMEYNVQVIVEGLTGIEE